jgi:hypothetical protein
MLGEGRRYRRAARDVGLPRGGRPARLARQSTKAPRTFRGARDPTRRDLGAANDGSESRKAGRPTAVQPSACDPVGLLVVSGRHAYVFACIRAEEVSLEPADGAPTSARNRLAATVTAASLEGALVRVRSTADFPSSRSSRAAAPRTRGSRRERASRRSSRRPPFGSCRIDEAHRCRSPHLMALLGVADGPRATRLSRHRVALPGSVTECRTDRCRDTSRMRSPSCSANGCPDPRRASAGPALRSRSAPHRPA